MSTPLLKLSLGRVILWEQYEVQKLVVRWVKVKGHSLMFEFSKPWNKFAQSHPFAWASLAGALTFAISVVIGYGAIAAEKLRDEIPTWSKNGVLGGYSATESECKHPRQLWIQDGQKSICIRYFMNQKDPVGRTAVVFFRGDLLGFDWKDGNPIKAKYTDNIEGVALLNDFSQLAASVTRAPFLLVSRPGTAGSSGDHKNKFRYSEARVINLALDQLKLKYGFKDLVLAGHSGGALLVANLLAKRSDIKCAVMASGAVALDRGASDSGFSPNTYLLWEDPMDSVANITNRTMRLFILAGKGDKIRPPEYQKMYADALAVRESDVQFLVVRKKGNPHDLEREAIKVAEECAFDAPLEQIEKSLKIEKNY